MASIDVHVYHDEMESPPRPQFTHKKTWQELKNVVREIRKSVTRVTPKPRRCFQFRNYTNESGASRTRLYFLGVLDKGRENTLLRVDLPDTLSEGSPMCDSHFLLTEPVFSSQPSSMPSTLSREEQLRRERQRLMAHGITSYDFEPEDGLFLIPAKNSLYTCIDEFDGVCLPTEIPTETICARLDPKICPGNSDLVAFIHDSDIWLVNRRSNEEMRLTYVHTGCGNIEMDCFSAGVPSYVIQEEFDRYTGYWWSPEVKRLPDQQRVYQILYEEVDESDVEILTTFAPPNEGSCTEPFRYPKAGTCNAKSTLKLLEITVSASGWMTVMNKEQTVNLFSLCPWAEYLTRAGWTPDGKFIYAIVMDRLQERLAILLLSPESFSPYPSHPSKPPVQCIYDESSDVWINVHNCLHFFPQTSDSEISFLFASESSGYRHIYYLTSVLHTSVPVPPPFSMDQASDEELEFTMRCKLSCVIAHQHMVTSGPWVVLPKQIWIDESRSLVFFMGLRDTPLESHLYVSRYDVPMSTPKLLTQPGFSHSVCMSQDMCKFVTEFSSLECPTRANVYRIYFDQIRRPYSSFIGTLSQPIVTTGYIPPTPFQFQSRLGHTVHGLYFKPHGYVPGKRYPTVLSIYGGPQVQMVSNTFKGYRFFRLHVLAAEGYMVVMLDCRGSNNRGLHFEGVLKNKLGTMEVDEQVEGLLWLASQLDCIDLSRVAVKGWSYGGYLSLMALMQRNDIFKVAISGAPVVDWELYDTGYTERYLGLPQTNADVYRTGNVLSYIQRLPENDTRLLLIHGLIDENVHFHHSSALINELISACKPYVLQVYPNERHGIGNSEAVEHHQTTVLKFLQDHL